nr:hypothetical protein [Treponemataceae bacterium]
LDAEIFTLAMNQDIEALSRLEHGFSPAFYGFLALWFLLMLYFLFSFSFMPNLLYEKMNEKLSLLLLENLKIVYKNFLKLLAFCLRVCLFPFTVFISCFALIVLAGKFDFLKSIANLATFFYPLAFVFTLLFFLFSLSAFYSSLKNDKPEEEVKILLLEDKRDLSKMDE